VEKPTDVKRLDGKIRKVINSYGYPRNPVSERNERKE
tara:strand:+ start:1020 stop:1130 length:111 start_codon:yes stop_codon:yes gene_type:complete